MKLWQGYIPTPTKQLDAVYKELERLQGGPMFGDVAAHLKNFGAGKLSLPYKSVLKFHAPAFGDEAQTGPDCTSHAVRNAADIARAVEIDIKGEPEEWVARGATEYLYWYRGSRNAGMNPGRATEFIIKYGLLLREKYPFYDFSTYKFSDWAGTSQPTLDEASKHPCRYFLRITSVEQARDALAAGYGIHCGSSYGNDGIRDSKGRSKWNSSWNHAMSWGACDDTGDDLYFLVLNSWGAWNRGGHPSWGPIPNGSFLIPSRDAARMISGSECWAVGDVDGWPAKDLPNYGSSSYL